MSPLISTSIRWIPGLPRIRIRPGAGCGRCGRLPAVRAASPWVPNISIASFDLAFVGAALTIQEPEGSNNPILCLTRRADIRPVASHARRHVVVSSGPVGPGTIDAEYVEHPEGAVGCANRSIP